MTRFQESFRKARGCSVPLLAVRSADATATIESVKLSLNGKADSVPLLQWDVMRGITGINKTGKDAAAVLLAGQEPAMVSARPTDALGMLQNPPEDAIVFMHNLHLFWSDNVVMQAILNLRDIFKGTGTMLVGLNLTGSILPAELSEHTLTLDENLPSASELGAMAKQIVADAKAPELNEQELAQVTDAVMGLSAFAAETSIALNLSPTGVNVAGTWDRKRKMIESDGLLKVYQGKETFATIGGNDGFKAFNSALYRGNDAPKAAIFMDEIEKAVAQDSGNSTKTELVGLLLSWFEDRKVDGQMLTGVWGAGKSAGVKAIGNEFGIPVVIFNVASMQNQYVGNSQKRLLTGLDRIDAMCNGKPCVYATSNKLESLSPELIARFKLATFFFDLQNDSANDAIWNIYCAKWNLTGERPNSTGWTGREIEECCYKAWRLNISLLDSGNYIIPVSRSRAEELRAIRTRASGKFLSATESGLYRYEETAAVVPTGRKFRE